MFSLLLFPEVLALLIHELAHVLTAMSLGVRVKRVGISWLGPYVVREPGEDWQNVLISLAGPLANLLTVYITLRLQVGCWLCFCSLILGVWNLLPIPHSDGMRVYRLIRA